MDLGINGKVALVCASTGGLGLATARALAAEGAAVTVTGRRSDRAAAIAAALPRAHGIGTDLTAKSAAEELVSATLVRFGRIDILVLNGPGPQPVTAADMDVRTAGDAFQLLAGTPGDLIHHVVPAMRERGWGRIIGIGSSGMIAPLPNLAASNLGRAALAGYLKTLASEVASDGVTVNVVAPGRIGTDRVAALDAAAAERADKDVQEIKQQSESAIPLGRYGRPQEFGAVVAFLASDLASYVTGTIIRCDGGLVRTL